MTLIVSLRIPDGIIIAGDSFATMMGNLQPRANFGVVCPNCGHSHEVDIAMDPISMPSTTFPYAQKVFPFLGQYGIGTFGIGQLVGKTIFFALREFEIQLLQNEEAPTGVTEVGKSIGEYLHELLRKQLEIESKKFDDMDDNWRPLGFQIVGYDDEVAKTIEVHIGNEITFNEFLGSGSTVSGSTAMVQLLFNLYETNPQEKPAFNIFSLQDAIQYAEFLISTTSSQQQFSKTIPMVGGEIDIGLVTPFDDFQWIKRKELSASSK